MFKKYKYLIYAILALIVAYFAFPNENKFQVNSKINAPFKTVQRILANNAMRSKWLPKDAKMLSANTFIFNDCVFKIITDNFFNTNIGVTYKNNTVSNNVIITKDSANVLLALQYDLQKPSVLNKISNYSIAKKIQSTTQLLLKYFNDFLSNTKNVYGNKMSTSTLKDSTLISIKQNFSSYPTVAQIYGNIALLQSYANKNNANTTNVPMLNITNGFNNDYELMVALPINKMLENNGNILAKRLLAGGNILVTDSIVGGFATVDKVYKEFFSFKSDLNVISPAIPYQLLITDRSKEPDTSKWITKLNFPIF